MRAIKTYKPLLALLLTILVLFPLKAGHVSSGRAKKVARNAYLERVRLQEDQVSISSSDIKIKSVIADSYDGSKVNFYIANVQDGGFILISGDDAVTPILGYSFANNFDPDNLPPQLVGLLEDYRSEMKDLFSSPNLSGAASVADEWAKYESPDIQAGTELRSVAPLLTSTWGQGCSFNSLCPADAAGQCGHTLVGCVAVAMAQVMHYYKFPPKGVGRRSYHCNKYGNISADFGNTMYEWGSMANYSGNNASGTLLHHCGVSVSMQYGTKSSSAYTSHADDALKKYFRFSENTFYLSRFNIPNELWNKFIREQINDGHPLIYRGRGTGGHSFNVDGYQGSNHFHINWGWSGYHNGYFYLNDLTPGKHNFNEHQGAIFNGVPSGCRNHVNIIVPISASKAKFKAFMTITASNHIKDNADVLYGAGERVTLTKGFRVDAGCRFKADNSYCIISKSTEQDNYEAIGKTFSDTEYLPKKDKSITVFPNPANKSVFIDFFGLECKKQITILSLTGSAISEFTSKDNKISLDISQYPKGIYFIKILYENKVYSERLIIR